MAAPTQNPIEPTRSKIEMNSIQTPSVPGEKKRFLFSFLLLCSLAFTSVAFGGTSLIRFQWQDSFHPFTNSAGSATIDAEWIVYPNGLAPENNFYLTSTTPHMVNGSEILFFYYEGHAVFKLFGGTTEMFLNTPAAQPYIGTRVILGESRSVMRYRFSNVRTAGPAKVKLTCNNRAALIAATTSLPQSTIYVTGASNSTFPSSGAFQVVSSAGAQNISYTGTVNDATGLTAFTGCTGGTGTVTQGSELNLLSGSSSAATHFKNSVSLWNYVTSAWVLFDEVEFDRAALCHDCAVCGGCGFWGPMFESSVFNGVCATGFLPPIGVVDWSVSVDGSAFVPGNASNSFLVDTRNACGQPTPYQRLSYLENYQWIIKTPDKQ
jgi:hypothetical protein